MTSLDAQKSDGAADNGDFETVEDIKAKQTEVAHGEGHAISRTGAEVQVTTKTWFVAFLLSASFGLSFWPVPTTGQIQSQLVAKFDDPTAAYWITTVYTLTITVGFLALGGNSDLSGRRWLINSGNAICIVGHIVLGTANSGTQVIAAMAILGFGGGAAQSAIFALPELLPNKWRHIGIVMADGLVFVMLLCGPIVGKYTIERGDAWRWMYFVAAILQGITFVSLYFFYHPPKHPRGTTWRQVLRGLDYIGMLLFAAMTVLILAGIVMTTYIEASSPRVIGLLVSGGVCLVAFALWETFGNPTFPLAPPTVFHRNYGRAFAMPFINTFIVGMTYYSINVIYPTMNNVLWSAGSTDPNYSIALSLPPNVALVFGALLLATFSGKIRHYRWQLVASCAGIVLFGALMALVERDNMATVIALAVLQQICYGWAVYLGNAFAQMGVEQQELGVSGGLSGVARYGGGSIASAVYTTILQNKQTAEFAVRVPSVAIAAGLPQSSLDAFLDAFPSNTTALESIRGVTPAILEASTIAYQDSYIAALRMIALVSLSFGAISVLSAFLCEDIDHKMNNEINVFLENDIYADQNEFHNMEKT